jgi:hypothetical protein
MLLVVGACGGDDQPSGPLDPDTAPRAPVDRFSGEPATLLDRAEVDGLPGPGQPIDLDAAPFLVRGLGPAGERTVHYHLDVQLPTPVLIYVLHHEGAAMPVPEQLPVVGYLPGDHGYSDFWRVLRVDVPADYVANTATSVAAINEAGFPTTLTDKIVNCPVVPDGSTATRRRGSGAADTALHRGWYRDQIFYYFTFEEAPLVQVDAQVPLAPLYATFNVNPPAAGGGFASGFMTEAGGDQTHTVAAALAGPDYSSLWQVQIYDNAAFASVTDLTSAQAATLVQPDALLWNAPLVEVAQP